MDPFHLHHHNIPYLAQDHPPLVLASAATSLTTAGGDHTQRDQQRLPQWSLAETRGFLAIRADLDQTFMETKRNKLLWEVVSTKLKDKGYTRTPDQCKCKWKNLVTRYKGSEAMEAETSRQFPFQEDMRKIFTDRMERLLSFDEGGSKGVVQVQVWSDEDDDDVDETADDLHGFDFEEGVIISASKIKRRKTVVKGGSSSGRAMITVEEVKRILREFMRWQMQMEARWMEASETREAERRAAEREWRRRMEGLEEERLEMERRWREREEERREREEARAERRHELVVALLNKLASEGM